MSCHGNCRCWMSRFAREKVKHWFFLLLLLWKYKASMPKLVCVDMLAVMVKGQSWASLQLKTSLTGWLAKTNALGWNWHSSAEFGWPEVAFTRPYSDRSNVMCCDGVPCFCCRAASTEQKNVPNHQFVSKNSEIKGNPVGELPSGIASGCMILPSLHDRQSTS